MRKIGVNFNNYYIRIITALGISTVIFALTGGSWGFLITSILACAYFLQPIGPVLRTSVARLFIACIIILTTYQVEAVVFWLLHISVNPPIYVITTTLVVIIVSIWLHRNNKITRLPLRLNKIDALLIIPALLISGLYVTRVILPSESDSVSIIRSMTLANDDIGHFSMVDALIRNSSNLLIDEPREMAIPSYKSYPMGWHISTATAAASFLPSLKDIAVSQMTIVYFILKVITFAFVVLSITLFMYQLSFLLKHKLSSAWINLSLYFGVAFSTFLIVMPQMFEGFFSFFPVLIYITLFATIATSLQSRAVHKQCLDVALISFIVGSSLSWVLTGPVLAIGYLLLKLQFSGGFKKLTTSTYVGIGVFVSTFVFQLWDITHSSKSAVSTLASDGGITTPDFILIALLTGLFLFLLTKRSYRSITKGILYSILPLYVLVAAVVAYISLSSPQLSYYYYKLEIVLLCLLLPLGIVAFIDFANKLTFSDLTPQMSALTRLIIVIFIPIALIPAIIGYPYFENNVARSINYNLTHEDAVEIANILDHKFGQSTSVSYFFMQGNPARSIVASNIARMDQHNTLCISQIYNAIYSGDIESVSLSASQCTPSLPTIIIHTDQETEQSLRNILPTNLLTDNEIILKTDI